MAENNSGEAKHTEDKASWCTHGGDKHDWKQWHEYVKHCRKYRCEREGCGFFKKLPRDWTQTMGIRGFPNPIPTYYLVKKIMFNKQRSFLTTHLHFPIFG